MRLKSAEQQPKARTAFARDPRGRPGASASSRPQPAWLEPGRFVRWWQAVIHLQRRAPAQCRVWPMLVVPIRVAGDLAAHLIQAERHDDLPRAFGLHGADEALDDRDAAVLPHRAIPRLDALSATPVLERRADEEAL